MRKQKAFIQLFCFLCVLGLPQITLSSSINDPYHRVLSRGKPVTQKSTEGSHVASLATDGNYANDDDSQCASTTLSTNPYLEVDLDEDMFVYAVVFILYNGKDEYPNIKVITKDAEGNVWTAMDKETVENKFAVFPIRVIRYIRIERRVVGVRLKMCEVAAYNTPIENLAARKPANSNQVVNDGFPYKAVDLELRSELITVVEQNPWFRVDLLEVYLVHEVFLVNVLRTFALAKPLHDFNLRIGNGLENNGNSNPLCTTASLAIGEARSFYCDMFGRYINIHLNKLGSLSIAPVAVNTDNVESIKEDASFDRDPGHMFGKWAGRVMDWNLQIGYVSKQVVQQKWIRVNIKKEYNVVMILIAATKLQQFELKLGLEKDFDLQTFCVPGLHDMPTFQTQPFFCVERTLTKYIHIRQYAEKMQLQIAEIAAYEETKPVINYTSSSKYVWAEETKDTTISCDIKGYPAPVFSWIKNKTLVASGSSSLTLRHVQQTDSGIYECWGNNTHGYNARLVELKVTSSLRVCADHGEIKYDSTTSSVVQDFEIRGDQWYSSFDAKQMKFLQFREKAPKLKSCQLWLKTKHPKLKDGVVQGTLCMKDATRNCATTIDVHIRRCAAYFIYNFKNLRSTSKYIFCFEPAKISLNGQQPAISAPEANYALSHKTFQTEIEVKESYHCLIMCQLDKRCKSFNFSKKNEICELNTATRKEFPKNYGRREGYSYCQMSSGVVKVVPSGEL